MLGTNGRLVPTATRPEDLAAVALFPNPARQTATLTLPAALAAQGAHVTLLNSLGQRVQQRTLPPHAPSLELDLAQLAAGVYSVQVRVGPHLLSSRLTIF